MPTITIQNARVSDGVLNIVYARGNDSGGHGISLPVAELDRFDIDFDEVTILRLIVTWARRRNVSAQDMIGKTITVDPSMLRNLVAVT